MDHHYRPLIARQLVTKYAEKPPAGVVPDYDHPMRNGVGRMFVVIPLLMAIATIMVALRLYTRRFIVGKLGPDDCELCPDILVSWPKLIMCD